MLHYDHISSPFAEMQRDGMALIILRTITRRVAYKPLANEADYNRDKKCDRRYDKKSQRDVVRRPSKTLPCFLVHI